MSAPAAQPNNSLFRGANAGHSSGSDTGAGSDGWAAGLVDWSKSTLGIGGHKNRSDATTTMLVVPAIIGLSVALGAGVFRRKRKPEKNSTLTDDYRPFKGRP